MNRLGGTLRQQAPVRLSVAKVRVPLSAVLATWAGRSLGASGLWLFRHPLAVVEAVVVLVAWRGAITVGPLPVLLVVVVIAALLLGWWRLHSASFTRVVMWRVRGLWRGTTVYRYRWQPAMVTAALAVRFEGIEYLPRLVSVRSTGRVDVVRVRMLPGQTLADWASNAPRLAQTFGVIDCRVRSVPGRVHDLGLWGQWLDDHEVEVKPQTMASYRDVVARYVLPRMGHMRLQGVQPAALSKLYRDLRETGGVRGMGLSPRTVDYVHAVLRKAFNDAVRVDQILASNPVERAKRPRRVAAAAREVWTREQLLAFLESAESHRLYPFFHLAAYSGARRGELLNLRWADVDLKDATIRIRGTTAVILGKRVEGTTKGGRERMVTLDRGTIKILAAHRANQGRDRMLAGPDWSPGDYVFTRALGLPLYPDTVSQLMPKLIAAHNEPASGAPPSIPLPHARLHDLRHVHATILLLAGVPVHVVADRLGHADAAITLRVYAHVLHDDAARVADVFVQALGLRDGSA